VTLNPSVMFAGQCEEAFTHMRHRALTDRFGVPWEINCDQAR
jgi:uncharacterized glyoxalase superfamily protein PhnB